MNEQFKDNSGSSLPNLIFDEGLQDALPRIAEILLNAAMLIERESKISFECNALRQRFQAP